MFRVYVPAELSINMDKDKRKKEKNYGQIMRT